MMIVYPRLRRLALIALALASFWTILAISTGPVATARGVWVRELHIKSVSLDPKTKVATASGRISCTGAKWARVSVEIRQEFGELPPVYADGSKRMPCEKRRNFELKLKSSEGMLSPIKAVRVKAEAEAITPKALAYNSFLAEEMTMPPAP
jgi:hypothetical protein